MNCSPGFVKNTKLLINWLVLLSLNHREDSDDSTASWPAILLNDEFLLLIMKLYKRNEAA